MEKRLFKNIDTFKSNSDLLINFAFFRFIHLLGKPLKKITDNRYLFLDNSDDFFNNLKVKCTFEEKVKDGKSEGFLKLLFENQNDENDDFNTHIYSKLIIRGKEIYLNGREDQYDKKNSRIILSVKTLNRIKKQVKIGRTCSGCELFFSDRGIQSDTMLNSLINLFLNNKCETFNNKYDYREKMNMFVKKVTSIPQIDNDGKLFEIDENNNNRIKFENFVKGEIYFFQGPPGTGKTYTIKRIIEENETKGTYEKIIVSSYVHVAINNIIERMLGTDVKTNRYNLFHDFYQYMTVLYSDRALSKVKDSVSEMIELDTMLEEEETEKAEEIYKLRKEKSNELVTDFDAKVEELCQGSIKEVLNTSANYKINSLDKSEKFKRIFKFLNASGDDYIDYEKAFELMNELSNKFNQEFVSEKDSNWGLVNYSEAIKNYSNVVFCSLDTLQKELERQTNAKNILVIIDEASKSHIINYLLLLNHIDNITLLVLGDPEQLNQSLVFSKDVKLYSKIMTAFTNFNYKDEFKDARYKKDVIRIMKKLLYKLVKNKSNRYKENQEIGYERYDKYATKMWDDILSETFYETLFNSASDGRKELLNVHRRSRKEIFELSKFLYKDTYKLGAKKIDDDLLIPKYDVLTRIVIDNNKESISTINDVIEKWKKQRNKIKKEMNMGIITFYNDYKHSFEQKLNEINDESISIYTIDSSQGEEFTTVILYLDINPSEDREKISGFVKDYHRFNVAVSRAREQLIIIETNDFINEYNRIKNTITDSKVKEFIDRIHTISERGDSNA